MDKHLEPTYLGHSCNSSLLMPFAEYVYSSTARIFTDDCVLYRKIQNETDSKLLKKDMNNILRWESDWQMEFHPSKCRILRVTKKPKSSPTIYDIHEHKLEIVDSDKCLGVTIHTTINWNIHIESI